jgi:hypothetical protein
VAQALSRARTKNKERKQVAPLFASFARAATRTTAETANLRSVSLGVSLWHRLQKSTAEIA